MRRSGGACLQFVKFTIRQKNYAAIAQGAGHAGMGARGRTGGQVAGDAGAPTREFLYVEDAAEGILLATERYNESEPVNRSTWLTARPGVGDGDQHPGPGAPDRPADGV
jgi:hypothetical protein